MSSSEDEAQLPELGASSSKDPPHPLESRQTESDVFTTPTKKSLRRNLKALSPEKAVPPDTDLGASGSKDLTSDSDSESDDSEDVSSVKNPGLTNAHRYNGRMLIFYQGRQSHNG
jgi:hypothetical protein